MFQRVLSGCFWFEPVTDLSVQNKPILFLKAIKNLLKRLQDVGHEFVRLVIVDFRVRPRVYLHAYILCVGESNLLKDIADAAHTKERSHVL